MKIAVMKIYGNNYVFGPAVYRQKVITTIYALNANFNRTKYLANIVLSSCFKPLNIIEYLLLFVLILSFGSKVTLHKNPIITIK